MTDVTSTSPKFQLSTPPAVPCRRYALKRQHMVWQHAIKSLVKFITEPGCQIRLSHAARAKTASALIKVNSRRFFENTDCNHVPPASGRSSSRSRSGKLFPTNNPITSVRSRQCAPQSIDEGIPIDQQQNELQMQKKSKKWNRRYQLTHA